MQRVISYVDGFNLYFGIKAKGWRDAYWLDVHGLSARLLKPHQSLIQSNYFTSRVSGSADKVRRQTTFIEALQTLPACRLHFGHYLSSPRTCPHCNFIQNVPTEKMTDVNIATALLTDAFQDKFDTALLITADSDLTAPIDAVRRIFPAKRIIIAFPPERFSITLRRAAHGFVHIERTHLLASQLPDQITKIGGYILKRPKSWK